MQLLLHEYPLFPECVCLGYGYPSNTKMENGECRNVLASKERCCFYRNCRKKTPRHTSCVIYHGVCIHTYFMMNFLPRLLSIGNLISRCINDLPAGGTVLPWGLSGLITVISLIYSCLPLCGLTELRILVIEHLDLKLTERTDMQMCFLWF